MGAPKRKQDHTHAMVVAGVAVLVLGWMSRDPDRISADQRRELAARFKFERAALPEVPAEPHRVVRKTNPTCDRISSWVSSIGAGAAVGDLDGNGLPDDIVYADPRTEQIIVCPAPGTRARYAPFALTTGGHGQEHVGCSGAIIGDFDGDGEPDVLVHFLGRTPLLFLRRTPGELNANAFSVVPLAAGLENTRWFTACAVRADLDGDGKPDLVFGNYFPDDSETYDPASRRTQVMQNSHGWAMNGGGLHFLLARKPTRDDPSLFREVQTNLAPELIHGWVLGVGVGDLDGDFLPEVYCANDLGPDRFLHNRSTPGHLRFALMEGEEAFAQPGSFTMGKDTYHGMGVDFYDVNRDGVPDIFVSDITSPYGLVEAQMLWISQKGGKGFRDGVAPYRQLSEEYGCARSGWGWDAKFESFANSVTPDIFQCLGFIKGTASRWPELQSLAAGNTAYLPDPRNWPSFVPGADLSGDDIDAFFTMGEDGKYHNVNREVGIDTPMVSRAIATADVDGDGRMDFALANQWGPSYFYRNASKPVGSFLGLRVVIPANERKSAVLPGRPPVRSRPAYGAVATVTLPCGTRLMREVDGGNGHTGKRSPELHFGLGKLPSSEPLEVKLQWRCPMGDVMPPVTLKLAPDRWYTVVLGEGRPEVMP